MTDEPMGIGTWAVLVFVCELAMLAGLAVAGWRLAPDGLARYGLAVALPVAAAVIWGLWLAPRAARGLKDRPATAAKIVVFVVAGALLAATGLWPWGLALGAGATLALLMAARHEPAAPPH